MEIIQKTNGPVKGEAVSNDDKDRFASIISEMFETYCKKNKDYGNAYEKVRNLIGPHYCLSMLFNKIERIHTLSLSNDSPNYESLRDSLLDLANYCILETIFIEKQQ